MKQVFKEFKNFKAEIVQEFAEHESEKYEIPVSALSEVFRTKEELYKLLDIQGEYFLPPFEWLDISVFEEVSGEGKEAFQKKKK